MEKVIIKARKSVDKLLGFEKIVYRIDRKRVAEIDFSFSCNDVRRDSYRVLCAFNNSGDCLSFDYKDLQTAIQKTLRYFNGVYLNNCEIIKCY